MKQCAKCRASKNESEFSVCTTAADGLQRRCRSCQSIDRSKNRKENREREYAAHKEWRSDDPVMWRNRAQQWREENPEAALVSSARSRAKKKGLEFNITSKDVVIPEYCPILGLKLERAPYGSRAGQPQSPSIDRLDATKGYIPGNVWVISRKANIIKTDATLDELVKVGEWAALTRARKGLIVLV